MQAFSVTRRLTLSRRLFLYPATDIHPTANNFQPPVNITALKLPQTPHLAVNNLQPLNKQYRIYYTFLHKGQQTNRPTQRGKMEALRTF